MDEILLWLSLLGISLLVSSLGFIRVVFFISIGYGYSIAAMSIFLLIVFFNTVNLQNWIQLVLLALYGARLGTYILLREKKQSYQTEMGDVKDRESKVGPLKRIPIWIGVSILYVTMITPGFASFINSNSNTIFPISIIGLTVLFLGLLIETIADAQKSKYKKTHPKDFCNTGLYKQVRCPNYFGEILVWLGSFIAAIPFFTTWYLWLSAIFGLVCIILIMMGSTKRLESKQELRYGDREDFKAYCKKTPVLFPFIKIYSLKNVKVFLE